jgi:signal peptidase II
MTAPVAPAPARRPHWVVLAAVVAVVLAADQLSKAWAVNQLASRTINVGWTLRFFLTYNSGTAFSLGPGRGQLISVVAVVVVGAVLFTARNDSTLLGAVARGLIVGGAAGNLLDRVLRAHDGLLSGRVVDFIDFQWWPVFNIADSAVVIGCLLLVINMVFRPAAGDDPPADLEGDDAGDRIDSAPVDDTGHAHGPGGASSSQPA